MKTTAIKFENYGTTTKGADRLNCRMMSNPFTVGGVSVVVDVCATQSGAANFEIFETGADGVCRGNVRRMEAAGLWEKVEGFNRWNIVRANEKPYTRAGIVEGLAAIYPEITPAVSFPA